MDRYSPRCERMFSSSPARGPWMSDPQPLRIVTCDLQRPLLFTNLRLHSPSSDDSQRALFNAASRSFHIWAVSSSVASCETETSSTSAKSTPAETWVVASLTVSHSMSADCAQNLDFLKRPPLPFKWFVFFTSTYSPRGFPCKG